MPKAFSQSEKTAIQGSLMNVGLKHFSTVGIRKARIDDICSDVGISKGSFYAFFASKEDLFMSIANNRDAQHQSDMRAFLVDTQGTQKEVLANFFDFLMQRIETDPVLIVLRDNGELNHLMRRISPELLAENAQRDKEFMANVIGALQTRHKLPFANSDIVSSLMALMLSTALQAETISASGASYAAVITLLREMFIARLLKGPMDD